MSSTDAQASLDGSDGFTHPTGTLLLLVSVSVRTNQTSQSCLKKAGQKSIDDMTNVEPKKFSNLFRSRSLLKRKLDYGGSQ